MFFHRKQANIAAAICINRHAAFEAGFILHGDGDGDVGAADSALFPRGRSLLLQAKKPRP
jgi:hypothetical protein